MKNVLFSIITLLVVLNTTIAQPSWYVGIRTGNSLWFGKPTVPYSILEADKFFYKQISWDKEVFIRRESKLIGLEIGLNHYSKIWRHQSKATYVSHGDRMFYDILVASTILEPSLSFQIDMVKLISSKTKKTQLIKSFVCINLSGIFAQEKQSFTMVNIDDATADTYTDNKKNTRFGITQGFQNYTTVRLNKQLIASLLVQFSFNNIYLANFPDYYYYNNKRIAARLGISYKL